MKHNGEWHRIITGSHPQLYIYICYTLIAPLKQPTLQQQIAVLDVIANGWQLTCAIGSATCAIGDISGDLPVTLR